VSEDAGAGGADKGAVPKMSRPMRVLNDLGSDSRPRQQPETWCC